VREDVKGTGRQRRCAMSKPGFLLKFIAECVAFAVTGSACNTPKRKKKKEGKK